MANPLHNSFPRLSDVNSQDAHQPLVRTDNIQQGYTEQGDRPSDLNRDWEFCANPACSESSETGCGGGGADGQHDDVCFYRIFCEVDPDENYLQSFLRWAELAEQDQRLVFQNANPRHFFVNQANNRF